MSDLADPHLLKFDMQLVAKRLKLKDKTTNILLKQSNREMPVTYLKENTSIQHHTVTNKISQPSSKENKVAIKAKKKRYPPRRPADYTWNR